MSLSKPTLSSSFHTLNIVTIKFKVNSDKSQVIQQSRDSIWHWTENKRGI